MAFADWQSLSPAEAARAVVERAAGLRPGQRAAAIAVLPPEAELAARFAGAARGRPLSGVPFLVKDLFDVAGEPTRAGSSFLMEIRPVPRRNAAIVDALRNAGAVLVGKTHLYEFAYGLTGENPHYGDCEHPHRAGRTTGGSSSGSALVVAAGVAPLAVGTDTGGSIRVPAAFCGLFGFRMNPGHPWIADAFPLAPSFDTAGWFTADAADMSAVLGALLAPPAAAGVARGCYFAPPGLDPEVAAALQDAAGKLGAENDFAIARDLQAGFAGAAEAYGILQSREAVAVHRDWLDRFRSGYSPEVWSRIDRGRHWPPDQVEAAQTRRAALRETWDQYFRRHDFLALPATPFAALAAAELTTENRNRLLALTAPASLGGRSVLTVPVALPSALSTGLQIVVKDERSPALAWALSRIAP